MTRATRAPALAIAGRLRVTRASPAIRHAATIAFAVIWAAAGVATDASACDLARDARDDGRIEAPDGTTIAWRAEPAGAGVDRHFALQIRACTNGPIAELSVDARMPEHRHGMNYKPAVTKLGADAWRADGLLFHMPGKWELIFAVATPQGVKRYTHALTVR